MFDRAMIDASETASLFDAIYMGALSADSAAIDKALLSVGINIPDKTFHSPVQKLAIDGQYAAVEFLMTKYNVEASEVIKAYAEAKDIPAINNILKANNNNTEISKELMKNILRGYARGNQIDMFNNLWQTIYIYATGPAEYADVHLYCIFGYVASGNLEAAHEIYVSAQTDAMHEEYLETLIWSYGFIGDLGRIEALANTAKFSPEKKQKIWINSAFGLARGGHIELLNRLLAGKEGKYKDEILIEVGCGFARSGFPQYVNIALAEVSEERRGDFVKIAVEYFVFSGFYSYAINLLDIVKESERTLTLEVLQVELLNKSAFAHVLFLLKKTITDEEKKLVLNALVIKYLALGEKDQVDALLNNTKDHFSKVTITKRLIFHCAKQGEEKAVKAYNATRRGDQDTATYLDFRLMGYLAGGQMKLLKSYADGIKDSEARKNLFVRIIDINVQLKCAVNQVDLFALVKTENELSDMALDMMSRAKDSLPVLTIFMGSVLHIKTDSVQINFCAQVIQHYMNDLGIEGMFIFAVPALHPLLPAIVKKMIENGGIEKAQEFFLHSFRKTQTQEMQVALFKQFVSPANFRDAFTLLSAEKELKYIHFFINNIQKSISRSELFSTTPRAIARLAEIADKRVRAAVAKVLCESDKILGLTVEMFLVEADKLNQQIKNVSTHVELFTGDKLAKIVARVTHQGYKQAFFKTPFQAPEVASTDKKATLKP